MIPLNLTLNKLSDYELLKEYEKESAAFGKQDFFPVFALRISRFKPQLFAAATSKINMNSSFFNLIRMSWLPVLSILQYCDIENIKQELKPLIEPVWDSEDFDNFKLYLKTSEDYEKYFV